MRAIWPALYLMVLSTCAADPTIVSIAISVDSSLPPISLMKVTLNQSGSPRTAQFRSVYFDTDAGPPPFIFPSILQVPVPGATTGMVDLTVEGIDWRDLHVIARGSGTAQISARHTTQASVTLTAVGPTPGDDGGATDGDPGAAPDSGALDAPADDVSDGSD